MSSLLSLISSSSHGEFVCMAVGIFSLQKCVNSCVNIRIHNSISIDSISHGCPYIYGISGRVFHARSRFNLSTGVYLDTYLCQLRASVSCIICCNSLGYANLNRLICIGLILTRCRLTKISELYVWILATTQSS